MTSKQLHIQDHPRGQSFPVDHKRNRMRNISFRSAVRLLNAEGSPLKTGVFHGMRSLVVEVQSSGATIAFNNIFGLSTSVLSDPRNGK